MYRCTDCDMEFEFVEVVFETHGLSTPPYERIKRCPFCRSTRYEETQSRHCRFCGSRLRTEGEYCSDRCKSAGQRYFAYQRKHSEQFKSSPVATAVREVAEYNRLNGTKYSYGQYFSLAKAFKPNQP